MRMATDRIARHRFGPTERILGVIGQGTWYLETGNRASSIAALRAGIDLGMTMIDTAEMYGAGAAERLIGEAIAGRRDEIFLVSKVLPEHASRRGTIVACERSLMRLKTDRLDSYLLHWRGQYPLAETIAAFEQLRADGKIRSWGVSNFDVPDLEEAWAIAGQGRIACNQVLYHLRERAIEHAVLPWCERHVVAVVGYSPFGHGHFPSPQSSQGRVCCRPSPPRTMRHRARWRCDSWYGVPPSSRSPRPPRSNTPAKTRAPGACS
jgi:diketogulonate reductase-like aldo/keto reductase